VLGTQQQLRRPAVHTFERGISTAHCVRMRQCSPQGNKLKPDLIRSQSDSKVTGMPHFNTCGSKTCSKHLLQALRGSYRVLAEHRHAQKVWRHVPDPECDFHSFLNSSGDISHNTSPVPQRDDAVGEAPVDAAVGAAVTVAAPSEGARQPEVADLQQPLLD